VPTRLQQIIGPQKPGTNGNVTDGTRASAAQQNPGGGGGRGEGSLDLHENDEVAVKRISKWSDEKKKPKIRTFFGGQEEVAQRVTYTNSNGLIKKPLKPCKKVWPFKKRKTTSQRGTLAPINSQSGVSMENKRANSYEPDVLPGK